MCSTVPLHSQLTHSSGKCLVLYEQYLSSCDFQKVVQNTAIANVSELKQKENKQEMYEEIECMHPYNEEKEGES